MENYEKKKKIQTAFRLDEKIRMELELLRKHRGERSINQLVEGILKKEIETEKTRTKNMLT